MNANEAAVPSTGAATRAIVYEQPLNERMRNFLRLDFLYQQAVHHHTKADSWSTRAAVSSLLEILAITQRGDIRSEVLKELERQMSLLSTYGSRPGVDAARLRVLLVDVPEELQVQRLMMRDGVTHEQARASLNAQATRAERLALADDIVHNTGRVDDLRARVAELHDGYLRLAGCAPRKP